jgi:release factor glutamine methyltransferase
LREATKRLERAGIEDAPLEAELLLAHALGVSRAQLFARLAGELPSTQRTAFEALLRRRLAHEPLAYITGHREFYGIDLLCSPAALIPRPETELLVDLALQWVEGQGSRVKAPVIVDVGTGSGAIAIAIAANAPRTRVVAIDTSAEALELATTNAERVGVVDRVMFVQGSLLEPLRGQANVIVANLPYIPDDVYASLPAEIRDHEPEAALRAGPRGTELIESFLTQSGDALAPGGLLVAEHAWDQGEALRETAAAIFTDMRIETRRDMSRLDRALVVRLTSVAG